MSDLSATSAAPRNWDSGIKTIHWTMAALIPLAWLLAILREDQPRETAMKLMMAHKSIGALILLFVVVRLLWRAGHAAPDAETTPWEPLVGLATRAGHGLLYLLMIMVPIGGIVTSFANGRSVPFFGLFEIASPWVDKQPFAHTVGEMHGFFGHLLIVVALAHAVAGLVHHFVLKDSTLTKMSPFARD